jgi:hypothetical protein
MIDDDQDDDQDEHLLGTMATALVAIDEIRDLTMFQMPYPPPVQRALDQLVLHCLRRHARPPKSVPDLVRWGYERPLGTWPLSLSREVYPADELLVDDESGAPTALCHEIALSAESENPLREAARQMAAMTELATEYNQPSAFRTMRRLLATHLAVTNELLNNLRFANKLGALDEYLGDFYPDIGAEYVVDGAVFPCARCGTPLRPTDSGSWWCEREECSARSGVSPANPLDWDADVKIQLNRRHRQFVSGPGRAVLRIADSLTRAGVKVRLWPEYGPGDLQVEVPGEHPWIAVVVDWHSPALLGRSIAVAVTRYGTDSVVWVVAQYRVHANPGYLRIVREHATMASGTPEVCSEVEFTEMVRRRGREDRHA